MEEEIKKRIEENKLEKIKDSIYLTQYQKRVLETYHIPFKKCNNLSELLFLLEEYIGEEELEELEQVACQIEEFHYYNETHK